MIVRRLGAALLLYSGWLLLDVVRPTGQCRYGAQPPRTASNATFPLAANGVVHGLDRVVSLSWDLGNGDTREVANPNGTLLVYLDVRLGGGDVRRAGLSVGY